MLSRLGYSGKSVAVFLPFGEYPVKPKKDPFDELEVRSASCSLKPVWVRCKHRRSRGEISSVVYVNKQEIADVIL